MIPLDPVDIRFQFNFPEIFKVFPSPNLQRLFTRQKFLADFRDSFDVLTIALPAGLPAAMSIGKFPICLTDLYLRINGNNNSMMHCSAGTAAAEARLAEAQIACTSPRHIVIGGSVNCFAFDKTGTLTATFLDLCGVQVFGDAEGGIQVAKFFVFS